jgi:hypothetical protein
MNINFRKIFPNATQAGFIVMFTRLLSNRNTRAAFASCSVVVFYLFQLNYSWAGLQASGIRGSSKYIDQESVLNSANCFKEIGIEVYKLDAPNGCGGFVYSVELLRILNFFHLSTLSSEFLGAAFMWLTVAALCSLFFLIKNLGRLDIVVAAFAFVSPGVWLLLERGNYDELVFILVLISSYFLASRYQELGIVLLAITVLIKFYTLPVFLICILFLKRKKSRILFGWIAFPIIIYIVFLIKQVEIFPSTWNVSFGLDSLGLYINLFIKERILWDLQLPSIAIKLTGVCGLVFWMFCLAKIKNGHKSKLNFPEVNSCVFIIYTNMTIIFLSCFFAGMNYDYRLVYLAASLALTPRILAISTLRNVITISGCVALGFSAYAFGQTGIPALIAQVVGDFFIYILVAAQLLCLNARFSVAYSSHFFRFLSYFAQHKPSSDNQHKSKSVH